MQEIFLACLVARESSTVKFGEIRPSKVQMIQPLDREQTRRLLEAAEGDRLHAFYVVAVPQGCAPARCWRSVGATWTSMPVSCG
jgi:hypothetical protein